MEGTCVLLSRSIILTMTIEPIPKSDLQTKLSAMFQPKSSADPDPPTQRMALVIDADDIPEVTEGPSRELKRTHSVPLQSLHPPADANFHMPLSQPAHSSATVIDITDESVDPIKATTGGSRDEPIRLDDSPSKNFTAASKKRLQKPGVSSFFAPRRKADPNKLKILTVGEGEHAPYTASANIHHVRGPQQTFEAPALGFSRSNRSIGTGDISIDSQPGPSNIRRPDGIIPIDTDTFVVRPLGSMEGGHVQAESILQSHSTKPEFMRFLCPDYDISGSSLNERWRPRCAAEVLGNVEEASFLRDWLLALEIQDQTTVELHRGSQKQLDRAPKRPSIIRSVTKSRKRRRVDSDEESLDDWIASDNEEDVEVTEDEDEDFEGRFRSQTPFPNREPSEPGNNEGGSPWKPKHTRITRRRPPDSTRSESPVKEEMPFRRPVPAHDFSDRLSNCILLAGPSGVGKTAAVYACAEELGWEVFEVYPGIGKRNGASLLSLVGDVTKNHIVKRRNNSASRDLPVQGNRKVNFFQPKVNGDKVHSGSLHFKNSDGSK